MHINMAELSVKLGFRLSNNPNCLLVITIQSGVFLYVKMHILKGS